MDQELRELRRAMSTDPEAQKRYIAALERLAGVGNEPIKFWQAFYIPFDGLQLAIGVELGRCWDEIGAWRAAAQYFLDIIKSNVYPDDKELSLEEMIRVHGPYQQWSEDEQYQYNFYQKLKQHFNRGEFQEIVDSYHNDWGAEYGILTVKEVEIT